MRNKKGQFVKGFSSSPETQFKRGQHWRKEKPFWEKEWLENEYCKKFRAAKDIANEFSVTEEAILFWLRKHEIKTREMSDIRKRKYWGLNGSKNGMYGKRGNKNPNWKGGCTAERQIFYSSIEWKNCIRQIYINYSGVCAKCQGKENLCIHHIVSFAHKDLRATIENLVLLCEKCHHFVHSKANTNNDFIGIELNPAYITMSEKRLHKEMGMFANV